MTLSIRKTLAVFVAFFAIPLVSGDSPAKADPPLDGDNGRGAMGVPVIVNLAAVSLPAGRVSIAGLAIDDQSLAGCTAYFRGDGISRTAIILADGTFATTIQRPNRRDFVVGVTVVDADGNVSDEVLVLISGP